MKRRRPRTCVGCGTESPKGELLRIVRTPEGQIVYDPTGKACGRGAYLCRNADCLELEMKRRGLARALKSQPTEELHTTLKSLISDHGNRAERDDEGN